MPSVEKLKSLRDGIDLIRPKIIELLNEYPPSKDVSGQLFCPLCSNIFYFSVSSNGHVWARCSNNDCVGWAE